MEKKEVQGKLSVASSFRDPDGFVFSLNGIVHRQVNHSYSENYEWLNSSGLYKKLSSEKLLVTHEETNIDLAPDRAAAFKVLLPRQVPFISYPYEWSFSQLKDAALCTLYIQQHALGHGMTLKDASAYNIQFIDGKPVHIDTLSFEKYREGAPWDAFKQFCEHFLAPLALMSYTDVSLGQLLRIHLDGIPLPLASKLLPLRTYFNLTLLSNIHLHARSQKHYSNKKSSLARSKVSKQALIGIIGLLRSFISQMKWEPKGTEWADYYSETNYDPQAFEAKQKLVSDFLALTNASSLLDLGANTGLFSRVASERGIFTLSCDIDPAAVEKNYLELKKKDQKNLLPLLVDINNPLPGIGWENTERDSFLERASSDVVMMLALIHHLCISNNLPFSYVASLAEKMGNWLIIEFVPKTDSQVERLLQNRKDIFENYTPENFEQEFSTFFEIVKKEKIQGSGRTLYLMKVRKSV